MFAFRVTWDLDNAVRLLWRDRTLHAYPIFGGTRFVCGRSSLYPDSIGNGDGPAETAAYGRAMLVDLRTGRRFTVRSAAQCRRAQEEFVPGTLAG